MKERYIKIHDSEYYIRQYKPKWMTWWKRHWSGNKSQKEILESLYEQLKKLM